MPFSAWPPPPVLVSGSSCVPQASWRCTGELLPLILHLPPPTFCCLLRVPLSTSERPRIWRHGHAGSGDRRPGIGVGLPPSPPTWKQWRGVDPLPERCLLVAAVILLRVSARWVARRGALGGMRPGCRDWRGLPPPAPPPTPLRWKAILAPRASLAPSQAGSPASRGRRPRPCRRGRTQCSSYRGPPARSPGLSLRSRASVVVRRVQWCFCGRPRPRRWLVGANNATDSGSAGPVTSTRTLSGLRRPLFGTAPGLKLDSCRPTS